MKIKALIFDCDGTLMNTIPDYTFAMNHTLSHFGYPTITQEKAFTYLGYGTDHFLTCALGNKKPSDYEEIKKFYLDFYFDHCFNKTIIYKGVPEFLTKAKEQNYLLGVCSNKPEFILKKIIAAAFPTLSFDFVGGQVDEHKKPDPFLFERCLKKLEVGKEEVAYFGDTEVDQAFATNAKVSSLYIVTYGFRSPEFLEKETKPLEFINHSEDLINLFATLKGE